MVYNIIVNLLKAWGGAVNIRELNSLMTSHDIKNRLPRGRRSVNEGLVHQVKSMVDPQYDSCI